MHELIAQGWTFYPLGRQSGTLRMLLDREESVELLRQLTDRRAT